MVPVIMAPIAQTIIAQATVKTMNAAGGIAVVTRCHRGSVMMMLNADANKTGKEVVSTKVKVLKATDVPMSVSKKTSVTDLAMIPISMLRK